MIKRSLISHYNAPYRGPKDKSRINTVLNSIKIDVLNVKKYCLYLDSKIISVFKSFLFNTEDSSHEQFDSSLNISKVINNNVVVITNLEKISKTKFNSIVKEIDTKQSFIINNIEQKDE